MDIVVASVGLIQYTLGILHLSLQKNMAINSTVLNSDNWLEIKKANHLCRLMREKRF